MSRHLSEMARLRENVAVREHEADIDPGTILDHPPAVRGEREVAKVLEILDGLDRNEEGGLQ